MRALLIPLLLLSRAVLAAPSNAPDAVGAGATFPAGIYQQWAERHAQDTGRRIVYRPSGSSDGVRQIGARAVDFGASDVPLPPAELEKQQLVQFPTLVGGIVPVLNLPGIGSGRLRLSAEVLTGLFSGRLRRWNEAAIAADNPGLALPDLPVQRIVRGDGSGTTEVFVAFLKQAAPAAAEAIVARGSRAQWPGDPRAVQGTAAVVDAVKQTPGAIGYVSSDYVARAGLVAASLRNRRGEWMVPTVESFQAAVRAAGLFRHSLEAAPLLDTDGPGAWPIVTATYVLVPRTPESAERAGQTLHFFYRAFLLGDKAVAGSGFAPLPTATQARIVALLAGFRARDGSPVPVMGQVQPAATVAGR